MQMRLSKTSQLHTTLQNDVGISTNAVAACLCVYFGFAVTRYMALKTAEALVECTYLLATSPLQAGSLAVLALAVTAYSFDRQGRALQVASAIYFRILSQLLARSVAEGRKLGAEEPAAPRTVRGGTLSAVGASSLTRVASGEACTPSSPTKEVKSFRIPDRRLPLAAPSSGPGRRGAQRRLSLEPPASRTQVVLRPKPRMSVDFDSTAVSTPRSSLSSPQHRRSEYRPQGTLQRRRSSSCDGSDAASGATNDGTSRRAQWRPSMHRIASGQELAALGAESGIRDRAALSAACPPSPFQGAAAPSDSAAALGMSSSSSSSSSSSFGSAAASSAAASMAAISAWVAATATSSAASAGSWVAANASNSYSTVAAGASSSLSALTTTVDSYLRPLVPAAPSLPSLQSWPPSGWPFSLPSTPRSGIAAPAGTAPARLRRASLEGGHSRASLDGTSRHYMHGAVTAPSSRREALERFAYAARMQARTAAGAQGFLPSQGAHPGHLKAFPAGSGLGCEGADASAVASIGLDGDCPQSIRDIVTDEHLLQFGAAIEEPASCRALRELFSPAAWGQDDASLYGAHDEWALSGGDSGKWEALLEESRPGLRLRAWRRPLRQGLFMYRSSVVLEGVAPRDVRPFHLDDQARGLWDEGVVAVQRVTPPRSTGLLSRHAESCMHRYTSRFPRPMAAREYNYARRVWHRPADGGCYSICRNCELPPGADAGTGAVRAVKVLQYISCAVIRAAPGSGGDSTEVASIYFEDSQVRAGLAKMAVPKGLWGFWNKYDSALRLFADARRAATADAKSGRRRRSVDAGSTAAQLGRAANGGGSWAGPGPRPSARGSPGEDSSSGTNAEVYDAIAELRAKKRQALEGASSGSRWARRVLIAGALRVIQVTLAARS